MANQGMTNTICEEEVHEALGGTKFVNAIGADKIPVQAWICMGKFGVQLIQIQIYLFQHTIVSPLKQANNKSKV